jgi:hypothetical protein
MTIPEPQAVKTTFCSCRALDESAPARHLLTSLQEEDCEFLRPLPDTVELHPETRIKQSGSIIVPMHFRHPLLGRDVMARSDRRRVGLASLVFIADSKSVGVHQTDHPRTGNLQELADGQMAFAKRLYSIARPTYGWIDRPGENALARRVASYKGVRFVFWANFLGPGIVKELGRRFVSACPASHIEEFDDGGMIVVGTAKFADWIADPPAEIAEHFKRKVSRVELYRPKAIDW